MLKHSLQILNAGGDRDLTTQRRNAEYLVSVANELLVMYVAP
jgi:hypothetical protein